MPKARLVFDGDNVYIGKDARIYKIKDDIASKIDGIPGVVDSLDSTSATDALSANMGRTLQDQINSLSGTGKFLSTWNCTTGLPGTNPQEDPYTYKVGDYYVVSATGSTNYKPHGGTYTQGVPSTTVELENVGVNDKYYFDGADWVRIPDTAIQIGIDQALSTTSTNAVENRAIATAVNGKQDVISDLSTIRAGAALGSTSIQPNDNISLLTNNIGYQTAGDVNSAIQSAIGQLPTVNDGVLTIQKNSTTIDTFSANSANNKTINIPVPTTVAELSDANNYATKTDLNNAIDSLVHEGSTAPQNPQEGDMWYDTVNHVLKIYNGTTWETVDTDTDTTYTAGNGINISAQHEISVDTSVVATKEYVDDKMSSGSTAPANPVEGQLWYDTTNDQLKVYDGTNWNVVGDDSADVNTKTFFIANASDLTTAQAALNWYNAGKHPIIRYNGRTYDKYNWVYSRLEYTYFDGEHNLNGAMLNGTTRMFDIFTSNGVVTGISEASHNSADYMPTNNTTPFTPTGDYNPATKKYVDDTVASAKSSGATAPSNPVIGQLWYDTTNNILMVYDGTNWVEVSSSSISDAAFSPSWDGDTTHAPSKNAIYDVLGDIETLLANL